MVGIISLSVWLGMLSMFFTSTAHAKIIFTCEDALPKSYDICKRWVKINYCNSQLYGPVVQTFCRKSCGLCKKSVNAASVLAGRYVGCYARQLGSALKAVPSSKLPKIDMTVEKCVRFCHSKSAKFGALQLGKYCYCGNSYGSSHRDPHTHCPYKCTGSYEQCGGAWPDVSVYEIAVSGDKNKGKALETKDLEQFILGSKGE